jgi:SH3 domain-containing protein
MNRLLLAVSFVAASYAVLQLTELRALDPPTSGSDQGPTSVPDKFPANSSSQAKQMTSTQSFSDVPEKPRQLAEQSETASSPEAVDVYGEPNWVEVLMPVRVHTGPSVETPIIRFYPVGTPLLVADYRGGWFKIIEPSTSKSGWIYWKYLAAIGNPDQIQIASQEAPVQKVIAAKVSIPVKRSVPAKRYAKAIPPSRLTKVEPAKTEPLRAHHEEMASLLQKAFSGY